MNIWGCRSFLSPWRNEDGTAQFYGRFNGGVVTLNLPHIALSSKRDMDLMWRILDERLDLCKEALMCRYERLKLTTTQSSPIHWENGALARLTPGSSIAPLLENGRTSFSLGYIGVYEFVNYMIGESHTTKKGEELALKIMNKLKTTINQWIKETGLGFGLYGSPSEGCCYKLCTKTKNKFGEIEGITDKKYFTNSYHVDVREEIDAFSKLKFESQFQKISSGGCISYVEVPNMCNNLEALMQIVQYIHGNIQYAEINTKSDYCQECGFDGELLINENLEWYCPNCNNKDIEKMNVCRRTCGYLGSNFWNLGKTEEISKRVLHI